MNRNGETFLGCNSNYNSSDIVIFGAPFDSTASYRPGARFGSRTMRAESYQLETYSPYQDLDLEDVNIFDAGDLELCFGDPNIALSDIERFTNQLLFDNKFPLMLGGEHLVTLGAILAVSIHHPDLVVVQFDAHADLRNDYLGAKLSHATVMRRALEIVGDHNIFQFGIRSGDRAEFRFARDHTHLYPFNFDGLNSAIDQFVARPVYITIDLDVLDPSVFPGTGTPEAGGVTFLELLRALLTLIERCRVVGIDLVELAPVYDPSGISTATALKLLREILLAWTARL